MKIKISARILSEVLRTRIYDTTRRRYILRTLSADTFKVEVYELRTIGKASGLKPIGSQTYIYTDCGFRPLIV